MYIYYYYFIYRPVGAQLYIPNGTKCARAELVKHVVRYLYNIENESDTNSTQTKSRTGYVRYKVYIEARAVFRAPVNFAINSMRAIANDDNAHIVCNVGACCSTDKRSLQ